MIKRRQKVTVDNDVSYFCAGTTDPQTMSDAGETSRILEGVVWTSELGHIEETLVALAPNSQLTWDTQAELPPRPVA
ncbi:hypothetical protein BCL67_10950 [Nesterenkonia sandarakina]|uniref:Uncharacterized protein n=1 Tax=Nesterenkonia sandarakina TaxID=272918 RepID=A0A2T0YJB2_9MICC|nr:hypothetical protein BCL67_10950 [Nesterenkonia sandarakina]